LAYCSLYSGAEVAYLRMDIYVETDEVVGGSFMSIRTPSRWKEETLCSYQASHRLFLHLTVSFVFDLYDSQQHSHGQSIMISGKS